MNKYHEIKTFDELLIYSKIGLPIEFNFHKEEIYEEVVINRGDFIHPYSDKEFKQKDDEYMAAYTGNYYVCSDIKDDFHEHSFRMAISSMSINKGKL